jgi:histidine phosphotransfer protein HptB
MAEDTRPPISEEWLERFSRRPDFLKRLFEVFLAEEPRRVEAIRAAVANRDQMLTGFLAHALKGAAATMGMERLSDACRLLEQTAKEGRCGEFATLFAAVEAEIAAVFTAIRAI